MIESDVERCFRKAFTAWGELPTVDEYRAMSADQRFDYLLEFDGDQRFVDRIRRKAQAGELTSADIVRLRELDALIAQKTPQLEQLRAMT